MAGSSWSRSAADSGKGDVTGDGFRPAAAEHGRTPLRQEGFNRASRRPEMAHEQFLPDADLERLVQTVSRSSPTSHRSSGFRCHPHALAAVLRQRTRRRSRPHRIYRRRGPGRGVGLAVQPVLSRSAFERNPGPRSRVPFRWPCFRRARGPSKRSRPTEALEVFTIDAATAHGLGAETGALEPGKSADLRHRRPRFRRLAADGHHPNRVTSRRVRSAP